MGRLPLHDQLLDHIQAAVIATDPAGRILHWNRGAEDLCGWTREEAIGRSVQELVVPAGRAAEAEEILTSAAAGQTWQGEFDVGRRGGGTVAAFVALSPLRDELGDQEGIVGISVPLRTGTDAEGGNGSPSGERAERLVREAREAIATTTGSYAALEALLDAAPVGLALLGSDGRYLRVNDSLAAMNGVPAEQHVERTPREVLGEVGARVEALVQEVIATGQPVLDVETSGQLAGDMGRSREWVSSYYPVLHGTGATLGVGIVASEVTARRRAERHANAQAAISGILAEATTVEDASPRILQAVCETLHWEMGAIWSVGADDGGGQVLRTTASWSDGDATASRLLQVTAAVRLQLGEGLPGRVWVSGSPEWIEDLAEEGALLRSAAAAESGVRSAFAFPVIAADRVLGVFEFLSPTGRPRDPGLVDLLAAIGNQIGQFLERKRVEDERERILGAERRAGADAVTAARRLQNLQAISDAALAHLDLDALLDELLARIRDVLRGDTATILLVANGGRHLAVRASVGHEAVAMRRRTIPIDEGFAGRVATSRRPVMVGDVRSSDVVEADLREGTRSIVGVPLLLEGRLVGVLQIGSAEPRRFSEEEVGLLELVAVRAAIAVENSRLFGAEQMARLNAERAADRVTRLQQITAALSATLTSTQIARIVVDAAVEALGASGAWIGTLSPDGKAVEALGSVGHPAYPVEVDREISGDRPFPIPDAVRLREPVYLRSPEEIAQRYPEVAASPSTHDGAMVVAPLLVGSRALGALSIGFDEPRAFAGEERVFITAMIQQTAQALERARLYEAEHAARNEAELGRLRLQFLSDAGVLLAGTLDVATALDRLARLVVGSFADVCTVDMVSGDGEVKRMAAVHVDPERQHLADELRERPPSPESPNPAIAAIRTGRPQLMAVITEELIRTVARDDRHAEVALELGFQSYVCVPLIARGHTLGALTLFSTDPAHRYGQSDVALAEDLARRAAVAVDNARLYDAEARAREAAENAARQTAVLQKVAEALSGAVTPNDVASVLVELGISATGAVGGVMAVLREDGETVEVIHRVGYPDSDLAAWRTFELRSSVPLAEAMRSGAPVLLESLEERNRRFPRLEGLPPLHDHALACIPLMVEGRSVGGIVFTFPTPRRFEEEDTATMVALGRQCAQALERARRYEAERDERRRRAFLAGAGEVLSESFKKYQRTLARVARLAVHGVEVEGELVPGLADWCVVDLLEEDGQIRLLAVEHRDPEKVVLARRLRELNPPRPDASRGVPNVLRTGQPELIPDISDELLRAAAPDEEVLRVLRELDLSSAMTVALTARGRTFGAITFAAESRRRYGQADLALAQDLARRAALAIDNARLYQERSRVAGTLQRALLPPGPPEIPGIEVAARYRPAGEGIQIGGDFYEVFPTDEGAWALMVGDVCGKGTEAVDLNVLARHTIRTAAMRERDPSRVLGVLNEAILRQGKEARFCTVAYLRLEPRAGSATATVSCGGHPLPVVLRAGGAVEPVGEPGTLIGVFPDPELFDRRIELGPGDAIVLYTDGVIEEHTGDRSFGQGGLAEALRLAKGGSASDLAQAIEDAVLAFASGQPRDDIAILVARVSP